MNDEIIVYVYGSCHFIDGQLESDSVGNGGYGVVITRNGKNIGELSGGFSSTTNARMDIMGVTEALKNIHDLENISIYITNGYVHDTLTKGWLEAWKKKSFKKKKHADLWNALDQVLKQRRTPVNFKHARDVRNLPHFKQAEHLGRVMSGKLNLPSDLKGDEPNALFSVECIQTKRNEIIDGKPIHESICVDASTLANPGPMEYRGVDPLSKKILFQRKYPEGTNNIGEFLSIVHALALIKKDNLPINIVYTDSMTALTWIRDKTCRTKYQRNEANAELFEHIDRAVQWIRNNEYKTKILKWNTGAWGEIPADYGRK